jgi:hypothetical protein
MSDIRRRIAQRHSIDLSNTQIQELAARRLESILDPRGIKPALLDQLRRSAGTPPSPPIQSQSKEPPFVFEAQTLYESHRGLLRFVRKLLNPILKLFFNPNPLIHALHTQAKLNAEALVRETERDQRQAEWNALHYEILQRLVTETSRLSLELQNASLQVESLAAKVDFNERRVRNLEGTTQQQQPKPSSSPRHAEAPPAGGPAAAESPSTEQTGGEPSTTDGSRRRRRRRRGRRGAPSGADGVGATAVTASHHAEMLEGGSASPPPASDEAVPAPMEPLSAPEGFSVAAEQEDAGADESGLLVELPEEQDALALEPAGPGDDELRAQPPSRDVPAPQPQSFISDERLPDHADESAEPPDGDPTGQ